MLSITINITWRTIMGAIFVGVAVAISSLGIGRAEHATPDKKVTVYNCNTGTACLTGNSSGGKTFGIYAEGTSYDALHAVTTTTSGNSAISGISTGSSGNGNGVYGRSSNGDGVHGSSSTANGVYGVTTASGRSNAALAGVYGTASNADGVYGVTSQNSSFNALLAGVHGTSTVSGTGVGVYGYATGYSSWGVVGRASSASSSSGVLAVSGGSPDIFEGENAQNSDTCIIDKDANLTCSGKISGGGAMLTRQRSGAGRHVLTYATQAATTTIEDLGASQMHDGIANVEVPADFAEVIDRTDPYYVFLTPMGDTRGLYVSMESAAGFQVRENMHGRSSVMFEYRIIGVPLGAKNLRLPTAPEMKVPQLAKLLSLTR